MARDSSPFAQRLKALAARAGKPASDDGTETTAPGTPGEPVSPPPADLAPTPDPAPRPTADVDPDELPTGEFPAIDEADVAPAPTPEPEATPEPEPSHESEATAEPAPEPTHPPEPAAAWPVVPPPPVKPPTSVPAPGYVPPSPPPPPQQSVRPIWLDPPAQPDAPQPSADTPDEPSDRQATPAASGPTLPPPVVPKKAAPEDLYAPPVATPAEASPFDTSSFDAVSADDLSAIEEPTTAFAPIEATPPEVTPESITGGVPAPDAPADDAPIADETTPSPENAAAPSTPDALNEALALPDDEHPATDTAAPSGDRVQADRPVDGTPTEAEPPADPEPTADGEPAPEPTAEGDTQATLVSAALPEPPRRMRLTRPGFLKRAAEPVEPPQAAAEADPATEADDEGSIADTVAAEPATTQFVRVPEPETSAPETSAPDAPATEVPASEVPASDPAAELATATTADPGSITSRFAAIGRLGKTRRGRKAETPAEPAAAAEPTAPQPEPAPEADPVLLTAEPVPYKPSFSERAALRRRAKSLRGRRDAGLLELGAIVLDQSRFGDPSGGTLVRRRTSELADLDSEIAAIEIALDDERSAETVKQLGVVHCTSCNALLGPADRFCATCGTADPGPGESAGEIPAS